jgi:hypothetical protein
LYGIGDGGGGGGGRVKAIPRTASAVNNQQTGALTNAMFLEKTNVTSKTALPNLSNAR